MVRRRRVTNALGDYSSFSLSSAGMFLSNVVENIKLEGVEPQSASPKNWKSRPLYLLLVAALLFKLERVTDNWREARMVGWRRRRIHSLRYDGSFAQNSDPGGGYTQYFV